MYFKTQKIYVYQDECIRQNIGVRHTFSTYFLLKSHSLTKKKNPNAIDFPCIQDFKEDQEGAI